MLFRTLLKSIRLPFLILTPVSIFLGYATSQVVLDKVNYFDFFLVLTGALLAHISVNTFNEYYDFRSGLDAKTNKTPFSGGSGALIDLPQAANTVLYTAIISLSLTGFIGIYFIFKLGIIIFPLGFIGFLIVLSYTPRLNRHPFLCLIAPGIGFGPLMVVGTHLVLTKVYSVEAFIISLVPFFLTCNLLLLNQLPDISADKSVGRRHFPIAYGVKKSTMVYGGFVLASCGIIIAGVVIELLPKFSLMSLLPLGCGFVAFWGARKYASSIPELIPYLSLNVIAALLTPLLLGIGILLG